ncbi:MAG: hypothetical protein EHM93_04845 [Bacteroidales bacterium]|nr:MAG: hypothetical protein EHM93_04845 [Bacteroidales bacterium]
MRNIYLILLFISLILSIFCYKKDRALYLFPFLLSAAFLSDIGATILKHFHANYFFLYHIYLPIEYSLLAYYFYLTIRNVWAKRIVLYSIPIFIVFSIMFSLEVVIISKYPNFQTNIECLLLVVWATIAIFTIEVKEDVSILSLPVFWICVAILIYQCGIFTFTGMFNYLLKSKSDLFERLRSYHIVFNCILYTLYSIAFICSHRTKKYY